MHRGRHLQCPGWPGVAKLAVAYDSYATALRSFNRPIADYLADILLAWRDAEAGADGPGRKIIRDAACVAALTLPAAVTRTPTAVPTLDAGAAHDFTRPGRIVDVLTDLDAPPILADLRVALLRHLE